MTPVVKPLIAGNWKMNGLKASAVELAAIAQGAESLSAKVDLMICPPATLLWSAASIVKGSPVQLGGQDCHTAASGAHTGDISAEMLADAGAVAVIVGHSERRNDHGESDALVRAKALAAWRAGLLPIVCIGETEAERDRSETLDVLARQLDGSLPEQGATGRNLVVAYEPVWAIGTGRVPTSKDVELIHGFIREKLQARFSSEGAAVRILYGGSVKPGNATELMAVADVGGALVGGASLKAADFLAIASACP
ncbi:MAG: triose-phosphate isomerase [Xanthobacteraceae bacterium]|nr:triose-phosphate isomerase [Xanthobacteraceae bacterium]